MLQRTTVQPPRMRLLRAMAFDVDENEQTPSWQSNALLKSPDLKRKTAEHPGHSRLKL